VTPLQLRSNGLTLDLLPDLGGCWKALRYRAGTGPEIDIFRPLAPQSTDPYASGGFALVPWSNRLFDRQLRLPEQVLTLPANRPGIDQPVHGVGWMNAWQVESVEPTRAVLLLAHRANTYWPYGFECRQTFTLKDGRARFELTVLNTSEQVMPAGLGFHPWFAADPGDRVAFQATAVWDQDTRGRPQVELPLAGGAALDCRNPREVSDLIVNHCYSGWGQAAVLERRAKGLQVRLTGSPALTHLMVYRTADAAWLCLEPVSHATGAWSMPALHRTECGVQWLAPGARLSAAMDIDVAAC
jgi:aldose 1-epimerase